MDKKRTITAILVATAVMIGWAGLNWYVSKYYPVVKTPPAQPQVISQIEPAVTQPVATTGSVAQASATQQAVAPATAPAGTLVPRAEEGKTDPIAIGSTDGKDPNWVMQLGIDPTGAGLSSVTLNQFKADVKRPDLYRFALPYPQHVDASRSLATRSLTIDGKPVDLLSTQWGLLRADPGNGSATYAITVTADGVPQARVEKTFTIDPKSKGSKGYEVALQYTIANLTDRPLKFRTIFNGTTLPPREVQRGPDRQTVVGYQDHKAVTAEHDFISSFKKDNPTKSLLADKDGKPLLWAGTASVYFNALVLPTPIGSGATTAPVAAGDVAPVDYLERVTAEMLEYRDADTETNEVITLFETKERAVAPGSAVTYPFTLYFGPKSREVLSNAYYAASPRGFDQTLVIRSGPCSVCAFDWLINVLVGLLGVFHKVFRDWGLAIIFLVVLVRLALHPITKRSQVHMMKMGKMGPEMEKLKKKHGDNKEELNKAMMQFYKQQGMTPVFGCLPMFLQMPIWIALYSSLQSTFELRQSPFLNGFTWIHDLAKPDGLLTMASPIHFFFLTIDGLNVLPLLLAVVFFIQADIQGKLQPAATPEQEQQKKMMKWMSLLFPVMLYSGPAGLNLYILTSTTIGIIESKVIRKHIKEREEAEKAGRVFVEARPTRGNRKGREDSDPAAPTKPGGIMGFLANLQDKAEQLRNDTDKKTR